MSMRHHVFALSLVSLACAATSFAATPVNLKNLPAGRLSSIASIQETSRHVDFNHTSHIRVQQTYAGHAVWGADAIVHIPHNDKATLASAGADTTMNGIMYQGLETDLANTPAYALNAAQADRALQHGIGLHQKNTGLLKYDAAKTKKELIVYVDKENKAHWAYLVSFFSGQKDGTPAVPTYILDAATFSIYAEWDNLQTLDNVSAGGFGGNPKMGKLSYDGTDGNYPALSIERDAKKKLCYLQNDDVAVKDDTTASGPFDNAPIAQFDCVAKDSSHNNLYWDGDQDAVNEGYSPVNDSMYIGEVIKGMYQDWYGIPALSIFGMPLKLNLHAHAKDLYGQVMDNAYFLSFTMEMYFGDGVKMFYPLTSLGVGAHEISHGFTSQHSNLTYEKQSGGLNESYSDMAAQAAEYYSTGTNSWQIGPEIVRGNGALRYMDNPTKDGKSIDNVKNYTDDLNVHYSSGVFNKAFYLMGTAKGWNTRKAFDVMVKANMDYWTANSTFADAACGVVKATRDYGYKPAAVTRALKKVGLDASSC
jgi:pseudolysin